MAISRPSFRAGRQLNRLANGAAAAGAQKLGERRAMGFEVTFRHKQFVEDLPMTSSLR